jgi:putative oxidoreductase
MFIDSGVATAGPTAVSDGLFIARLALGLGLAAHGAQKLFGWFGGYGLEGTGGFFESLGFHPGRLFAAAAGFSEFGGGVLVALGFLGPIGPALMIVPMLVASLTVHRGNGFFTAGNGFELPFLYAAGALALTITGFGALSLDALLGFTELWSPALRIAALSAGVLGGLASVAVRRPAAKAAA